MHNFPIGGHQGIQRTSERNKLYLSWPGLDHDVIQYVRQCKICHLNKETHPHTKLSLVITGRKTAPWENMYLEIVGPLPVTETSMKYTLTCQDNLNTYLIAISLQTAEEVTNASVKNVILIYGIPTEIA
jgi:hypothetical protein